MFDVCSQTSWDLIDRIAALHAMSRVCRTMAGRIET
jgi:hypothetical protein